MAGEPERGAVVGFLVGKGLEKVPRLRYRAIRKASRNSGYTAPRLRRLLLKRTQWDENSLARLVGIEPTEARCVLRQAGFTQSPDELSRPSANPDAVARRVKLDATVRSAEDDTP